MTLQALELCLALTAAQARTSQALDEALGSWHGLAWRDLALLLALQRAPAGVLSLAQAAARQGVAPSAMLRTVLPLEKVGWIERRGGQLALRLAGESVGREAAATANLTARRVLQDLPAEDRQCLHGLLVALARATSPDDVGPAR